MLIDSCGAESGSGRGREWWAVDSTLAWCHDFRGPRIGWGRDPELHLAFLCLGCGAVSGHEPGCSFRSTSFVRRRTSYTIVM